MKYIAIANNIMLYIAIYSYPIYDYTLNMSLHTNFNAVITRLAGVVNEDN